MNDAGLGNSPTPARPFDVTDEELSTELKQWTGTAPALHPVGELLDRHWEAAFAYARLCTDGTRGAGMLTTAAFTRLFGESLRQTGPTAAWRPQLLVTVRRIAAEWDNDGRGELLHPELRAQKGERVASRLLPPANRRLLSRAFQRLTQSSRAVLWHTEVESEPLSTPAGLLGLDEQDAQVELRRARERLREECLQVHRELAHEDECQRYVRMIDVTFRRGGVDVDRDLQQHLNGCKHCRFTADQLHQFNGGLGTALAEAVLGWGAHAYLESRAAGRMAEPAEPVAAAVGGFVGGPAGGFAGGEAFAPGKDLVVHPVASRRAAQRAARRVRVRRRNLAVAVGTVSGLVVLPLVLWAALGSGDDSGSSASAKPSATPGTGRSTSGPSWIGTSQTTQGTLRGRLHNIASGLCIGVVGKQAVKGAETELAECSSAASQQWTYDSDGLLRNGADPGLCLDSHLGYSVQLAPCSSATGAGGRSIRYDFTLQGALVPRWDQDLALAPAATDGGGALVVKTRTNISAQRWVMDTSQPDLQMQIVNWDAETTPTPTAAATPTTKSAKTPTATPTPSASQTTAQPTPSSTTGYNPCADYPGYCYGGGQYGGGWGGGGYGGGYGGYGGGYGGGHQGR